MNVPRCSGGGGRERAQCAFGGRRSGQGVAAVVAILVGLAGCQDGVDADLGDVVTLADRGASNPTVAVAPGDNGFFVAWVQADDAAGDVYITRVGADGQPVGAAVRVNDLEGDATPHEQAPAQVVVGPGGEVYVVWQRKVEAPWLQFGGADLRFARSTDGGHTFEPAITVNDNERSSPARISFHDIVVGGDGTVFVSWIDARERDRAREDAYRAGLSGQEVHDGAHVHPTGGADVEPGTDMRISASRDSGQSFGSSVVIDEDSCPCCRTSVVVSPSGRIYAAWRKIFTGGIRDIALARSDDGGRSFDAARPIHPDLWEFDACPHAGPSLAIDDEGRVHAAWYSGVEERQGLWYASSDSAGSAFSEPIPVLTDDWVPPSQARLAIDRGAVWVAWDDLREETRRVHLGRVGDNRITRVSATLTGRSPSVAVDAGLGILAWLDGQSVRAMVFGTDEVPSS